MSYWHFLIISAAVIVSAVLLYLVLSSVLSQLQVRLERRFARYGGMLEANA